MHHAQIAASPTPFHLWGQCLNRLGRTASKIVLQPLQDAPMLLCGVRPKASGLMTIMVYLLENYLTSLFLMDCIQIGRWILCQQN